MQRSTSVVCLEAFLKVGGDAYITLSWDGKASEKIDIFHDSPLRLLRRTGRFGCEGRTPRLPPSPRLRGTPFALETPERRVVEPIGIEPTTS